MSGLINLFKSLFGGILSFLGGLFGGKKAIEGSAKSAKKSKGYFLELDESEAKSEQPAKLEEVTSKPVSQQPMTVSVETATGADVTNNGQAAKTSTRKEKLAALAAGSNPDKGAAAPAAKAESAPAPKAAPATTVASTPTEATFATKYLVPTNNSGRRRPGANMSSYLDMARKMNPAG